MAPPNTVVKQHPAVLPRRLVRHSLGEGWRLCVVGRSSLPIGPYGLPDGEAAGEFCSDGVAAGLVSSFVAAVGDGTGVGVSAGVADI
jgi:hypothetical protein